MRTASTSEEVMEVQQTLRISLDLIGHDLRMAGFMVPRDERAFDLAEVGRLTIRTGSAESRAARIETDLELLGAAEVTFDVANAPMVNLFEVGDQVRILRPPNQAPPVGLVLTVSGVDPAAVPPQVTLSGLDLVTGEISRGDINVASRVNDNNTISYCLDPAPGCGPAANPPCPPGQNCIKRVVNEVTADVTAEIIATQITPGGLQFAYFAEDGGPTAVLEEIRAIRVNLAGQAITTVGAGAAPKGRALTSYIHLRNR
jgi:hypothetical protein